MKKWLLICLVIVVSLVGITPALAEKKKESSLEWLDGKDVHPKNSKAAVSRIAFADVMNQLVDGTNQSESGILETAEELGFWQDSDRNERAVVKQEEAVEILKYVFPMMDWSDMTDKGNKPVKWEHVAEYTSAIVEQVYETGTYQNQTIEGNALIHEPQVTLEDVTIRGDLFITKGAGADQQTLLDSVTVEGTVYVDEAVQNSVKLVDSDVNNVQVYTLGTNSSDWSLIWSDEFMTESIDPTKWKHDIGNWIVDENGEGISPGWGNNELEYYTDSPENSYIEDGKLVIEAKEEKSEDKFGTYDYTSAKLKTVGLFSKKYGKFEAKMKLPEGQGYWPAFWMMPEDSVYGEWPTSGEIDIMEAAGKDTSTIGGTIHYGEEYPNNTYRGTEYHFPDGSDYTGFHTYSIEWEPGEIRWYVDGELYQTLNNWFSKGTGEAANYTYPAPFDQEFYIILNLAVGGWYGGNPDETTEFPGKMEVDYVRVYELTGRDYKEPVEPTQDLETLPEDAKQPLEDGNLVYDQNYEQDFTIVDENDDSFDDTYWNFLTLPDFAGDGSISTEEVDGTTFAKTSITNPGNALWSLQMIQNIAVVEGHTYEVTFDAKSDANRTLMSKVSGGAERGYANYSGEKTVDLSSDVESYTYTFTHNQETDVAARLEFNMGSVSQNPVWIGNVRVEDVTGEQQESTQKTPLDDGNHIYNGTFDQGDFSRMTYWDVVTQNGAAVDASVDADERFLHMDVTDGGTSKEDVQLKQTGIQFLKGNMYELTFRARADEAKDIEVGFVNEDGSVQYEEAKPVSVTSEWNTYTVPFEMTTETTDRDGQVIFYMGGSSADLFIDDVSLMQTSTYVDYDNIDLSPLKNGDFTNGMEGWSSYIHFDANATISEQNEALNIDITNAGNEMWSVLAEYPSLTLAKDVMYQLSFDAKSTVDREIEVTMEDANYTRYLNEIVSLTSEANTFTFEFQMPKTDTVSLKYLMGQFAEEHQITINNVSLEVQK